MKVRKRLNIIAILATITLVGEIGLASDEGDFEYWSQVGVCFEINKDWEFEFEEELKIGDDASELYCHNSDFGFVYKGFAEWLDLGFKFKREYEKDDVGQWLAENRPHLNIKLKSKLFNIDVSNRSRFEYRDLENKKDTWRYRNMFKVKLPWEFTELKLQPYLAEEVFIDLDVGDFNKNRFYSGFSFKLSKSMEAAIFYLWETSESGGGWDDIHVIGTNLTFHF
jgi:hypothetical protein